MDLKTFRKDQAYSLYEHNDVLTSVVVPYLLIDLHDMGLGLAVRAPESTMISKNLRLVVLCQSICSVVYYLYKN